MSLTQLLLDCIAPKHVVLIVIVVFFARRAYNLVTDSLRDVPGPFLARYTRVWLLWQYIKGDFQNTNIELHNRYGTSFYNLATCFS